MHPRRDFTRFQPRLGTGWESSFMTDDARTGTRDFDASS